MRSNVLQKIHEIGFAAVATLLLLLLATGGASGAAVDSAAGTGQTTPYKIKSLQHTPGVWAPRNWAALTRDTGDGDPRQATAEKGKQIFAALVEPLVTVLTELSAAKEGDFPFCLAPRNA